MDLTVALKRALHLLEPECQRHGVVPSIEANGPLPVAGDPVAVDQIVHNLLLNALQAMDTVPAQQRALSLKVHALGTFGELQVADRGPGLPPEVLRRVFEPFYSTREGGLGLGLPLCETLAQGMGGSLRAANRSEGGAVFTLSLPLSPAP